MIASMSIAVSAADYSAASALNNKITLDGVKDDAYVSSSIMVDNPADNASAAGAIGEVWLAWDNDYLYVYNEVIDSAVTPADAVTSMWSDDGMEIYLNLSGMEGDYYSDGINAGQHIIGSNFSAWAGGGYHRDADMVDSQYKWVMTDTGYIMELAISWGDKYTPSVRDVIFILISVNDSTDGDPSTREYRNNNVATDMPEAWHLADSTWATLESTSEEYV